MPWWIGAWDRDANDGSIISETLGFEENNLALKYLSSYVRCQWIQRKSGRPTGCFPKRTLMHSDIRRAPRNIPPNVSRSRCGLLFQCHRWCSTASARGWRRRSSADDHLRSRPEKGNVRGMLYKDSLLEPPCFLRGFLTSFLELERTMEMMMASFSRPWNPSTVEISNSFSLSFLLLVILSSTT